MPRSGKLVDTGYKGGRAARWQELARVHDGLASWDELLARSRRRQQRRQRVDAEADRLTGHGATVTRVISDEGLGHYGIAMQDPQDKEVDVNCSSDHPRWLPGKTPGLAAAIDCASCPGFRTGKA